MQDHYAPREAEALTGIPAGQTGEDGVYYRVGAKYLRPSGSTYAVAGIVTRITVTCDLPGLHASMERVRVFDGETIIFEAPLHSLEGVVYPAPPSSNQEQAA